MLCMAPGTDRTGVARDRRNDKDTATDQVSISGAEAAASQNLYIVEQGGGVTGYCIQLNREAGLGLAHLGRNSLCSQMILKP